MQSASARSKGSKRRQTLAHAATSRLASPLGLPQHANEHRPERPILLAVDEAPELLRQSGPSTVASMHAKVHYPGPDGEDRSFDAEVPEPPPRTHVFTNPVDGTEVRATLEEHQDAMEPGGGVAIYGAES